jgi:tetratricopeptide (TPR) repeat protein
VAPDPPPIRYQNVPALFAEAATAFDLQDYESAIRMANEQLALPGREVRLESLLILAKAHLALGQLENSERYFEAAFEENSSIHTFMDASNAAATTEPQTPALKDLMARILKRGLEKHPRAPSLTVALAELYSDFSDPASAKHWLKKAIELDPKNPGLYLRLGQIYQSEENIPQAEVAYKTAAGLPAQLPQEKIRHTLPLIQMKMRQNKIREAESLIANLEKISNVFNSDLENIKKLVRGEVSSREITNVEYRPMSSFLRHRETKRNYLSVVNAIKKFGAVPVAVQYPRQSLRQLKDLLEYDAAVVFVGNEQNFERELRTEPYENLFYDNFAESFGHFTPKGAHLVEFAIMAALAERQILKN